MDNETILNEVLRSGDPGGQPTISSSIDFMRGTLHTIEFRINDELICQKFFYEDQSNHTFDPPSKVFSTKDALMDWVDTQYNDQNKRLINSYLSYSKPRSSLIEVFFDVRAVSSIIAIGIIATISFLLISDLKHQQANRSPGENSPVTLVDIPDVLSNALAIILGFYFGSEVGKRGEKIEEDQSEED
jgi:hypothetical protein